MCNFWPKKWSRSLKKFERWSLPRELLRQYLTEKQNGCLEVVAYGRWSLMRSGRYERVDCNGISFRVSTHGSLKTKEKSKS